MTAVLNVSGVDIVVNFKKSIVRKVNRGAILRIMKSDVDNWKQSEKKLKHEAYASYVYISPPRIVHHSKFKSDFVREFYETFYVNRTENFTIFNAKQGIFTQYTWKVQVLYKTCSSYT